MRRWKGFIDESGGHWLQLEGDNNLKRARLKKYSFDKRHSDTCIRLAPGWLQGLQQLVQQLSRPPSLWGIASRCTLLVHRANCNCWQANHHISLFVHDLSVLVTQWWESPVKCSLCSYKWCHSASRCPDVTSTDLATFSDMLWLNHSLCRSL